VAATKFAIVNFTEWNAPTGGEEVDEEEEEEEERRGMTTIQFEVSNDDLDMGLVPDTIVPQYTLPSAVVVDTFNNKLTEVFEGVGTIETTVGTVRAITSCV
jgi:hypothetical protein